MKECELEKQSSSRPSVVVRKNNGPITIINNVFCYIVHSFFTFRSSKQLPYTKMTTIDDKTETEQRSDDSLKSQEAPGYGIKTVYIL